MPGFQAFTADELTTGSVRQVRVRTPNSCAGRASRWACTRFRWAAPIISTRTTPTRSTSCSAARRHCGWRIGPLGRPGSIVSVDRHVEHGFRDITEDLTVLVLFAPPETPED